MDSFSRISFEIDKVLLRIIIIFLIIKVLIDNILWFIAIFVTSVFCAINEANLRTLDQNLKGLVFRSFFNQGAFASSAVGFFSAFYFTK